MKKRIITGREYEDLLMSLTDKSRKNLDILRTSFGFGRQYFHVETFTNITGVPSFLLVESEDEAIQLPPFLKILREVTDDEFYSTGNMS